MNKKKKQITVLSLLSATILTTIIVAVSPGSDSDPLISLGYLNGTWKSQLKTELRTEVDGNIDSSVKTAESRIENSLEDKINAMEDRIQGELADSIYGKLQSDIDDKIDSMEKSLNEDISEELSEKLVDEIYSMVLERISPSGEISSSSVRYENITLNSGTELHLGGNCEVIMRAGNALLRIESNTASTIHDDTDNRYIRNGENISENHLITVSGGSGNVFVITQNETQLMIRGVYTIVG